MLKKLSFMLAALDGLGMMACDLEKAPVRKRFEDSEKGLGSCAGTL